MLTALRGWSAADAEGLPDLARPGAAACSPMVRLFDYIADTPGPMDRTLRRQVAALCTRCPLRDSCPVRVAAPSTAISRPHGPASQQRR